MQISFRTTGEAIEALQYFNFFHDGFIKQINLTSQNYFDEEGRQVLLNLFDIEIKFAHFNYADPNHKTDQIVTCTFLKATDVCLDFRSLSVDWSIQSLEIDAAQRSRHGSVELCLALRLIANELNQDNRWIPHEMRLFTFTEASFEEKK